MNNQEYYKFLGKLYDILLEEGILSYHEKPKDLKVKKERLEKYLDKLERIQNKAIDNDRYLEMIRNLYYDRYIIKEENIPDFYFKHLEEQYLNEGHGHKNLLEPKNHEDNVLRKEHINTVINDQKDSLNNWLNYFLSEDSSYLPMWAKIWAFQGMLHIGNLNENKDGYKKRSKTTVNPFVSMDSEILGKCVELIKDTFDKEKITDEEIQKLTLSGSFEKIYGKLLANKKQIKSETTEGIWVKYKRETPKEILEKEQKGIKLEYLKLYDSLQGYNTGWCTAGSRKTAKSQILGGDFYVYYSKNKIGEYKIPRIAIRMNKDRIAEIRGIAENQNIESNMERILEEKLKDFPDARNYQKKISDMKLLTKIYDKHNKKLELTIQELNFIYEIEAKIKGFGHEKDPRIGEILKTRNKRKDLAYIFNCNEEEIGLSQEDLKRKIIYYFGDLDLSGLTSAEGLTLPQNINGSLDLSELTSTEGLTLPQNINGSLELRGLTSAEGLTLPQNIDNYLDLSGLTSAEGLTLPENIGGILNLGGLTSAKGLSLPQKISGSLNLSGLTSAEGLTLPQKISGILNLNGLTSAEGLTLPQKSGSLYLSGLTSAEGLNLPQNINGSLDLSGLTSAEGLILPENIDNYLCLNRLASAEGLTLPHNIVGGLELRGLTSAEGLTLPNNIVGNLDLSGLTSAEGLTLPENIGGILNLSGLTSAEGLTLPQNIDGYLILGGLTSAEGLTLPENINGSLELRELTSAEGLTLPHNIGGSLDLSGLTSAEGLTLPHNIGGSLFLSGLTSAEGLTLPKSINGNLLIGNLQTIVGLQLPNVIGGYIKYRGHHKYTIEEIKKLQKLEESERPIIDNSLKKIKTQGFVNNSLIIIGTLLLSLLSFLAALLIIKS